MPKYIVLETSTKYIICFSVHKTFLLTHSTLKLLRPTRFYRYPFTDELLAVFVSPSHAEHRVSVACLKKKLICIVIQNRKLMIFRRTCALLMTRTFFKPFSGERCGTHTAQNCASCSWPTVSGLVIYTPICKIFKAMLSFVYAQKALP